MYIDVSLLKKLCMQNIRQKCRLLVDVMLFVLIHVYCAVVVALNNAWLVVL